MKITKTFGQPMDVEGIVAFGSNPSDSFRYRLGLKEDKMNIWLENRKSKKQWCGSLASQMLLLQRPLTITDAVTNVYFTRFRETGELSTEDFVPEDGVIPHAKIADYVTVC